MSFAAFNKTFQAVQRELDARLPTKRQKLGDSAKPQGKAQGPPTWSKGEISTLIYGVLRLGEKEFTDLMNSTLFLKREHEIRLAENSQSAVALPDKNKHSVEEVQAKWNQIKVLRNLDVDRLQSNAG